MREVTEDLWLNDENLSLFGSVNTKGKCGDAWGEINQLVVMKTRSDLGMWSVLVEVKKVFKSDVKGRRFASRVCFRRLNRVKI